MTIQLYHQPWFIAMFPNGWLSASIRRTVPSFCPSDLSRASIQLSYGSFSTTSSLNLIFLTGFIECLLGLDLMNREVFIGLIGPVSAIIGYFFTFKILWLWFLSHDSGSFRVGIDGRERFWLSLLAGLVFLDDDGSKFGLIGVIGKNSGPALRVSSLCRGVEESMSEGVLVGRPCEYFRGIWDLMWDWSLHIIFDSLEVSKLDKNETSNLNRTHWLYHLRIWSIRTLFILLLDSFHSYQISLCFKRSLFEIT